MPAKRRRSYIVTVYRTRLGERLPNEEKRVLAYSEAGALAFYINRGYHVVSSRPYRKAEYHVDPPGAGFRINSLNLRSAERLLGLTWPIQITKSNHKGGRLGAYHPAMKNGRRTHIIKLKSWLNPAMAGATLWHELRHCQQAERFAERGYDNWPAFVRVFNAAYKDGNSYSDKPMEVEARATEAMNDRCPLARSRC